MEVLSSFELNRTILSLGHRKTISFQMSGEEFMMSYMDFSMQMGSVDVDYTRTESYSQLHIDQPVYLSANQV